ncbi:unnamed protein product, partial [Adineta ricciae]
GGRSSNARRSSQVNFNPLTNQIQWSPSITLQQENMSSMGRRRALDLYGTKDVVFTHEQIKKAKRSHDNTGGMALSG